MPISPLSCLVSCERNIHRSLVLPCQANGVHARVHALQCLCYVSQPWRLYRRLIITLGILSPPIRISWHDYAAYYTACPPLVAPSVERCEARPGEAALTWMDLRSTQGAHLSHIADEANFYTEYTRRAYTQYAAQGPPTAPRNTRLVLSRRIRPQPNLFAETLAGVGRRHSRTAAARHTAAPTSFLAPTYNRLSQSTPKSQKISTATSDPRPIWHT
jgi:hypothetical protein